MLNENEVRNIIENYIHAKDGNKPYLMKSVFADLATLEMKINTANISFPADTVGLDAITDVLVRTFSQTYENVYTFCLSDSFDSLENSVWCDWLVCMTERDGGNVRVGSGKYDWHFDVDENILARSLVITIEHMVIFEPEHSKQIFEWVEKLPYPFCDSERLFEFMPELESIQLIQKYVKR